MSRVAKRPISLGSNVSVEVAPGAVTVKGPKGALSMQIRPEVEVQQADGTVKVAPRSDSRFARALAGTTRALIQNMVTGVTTGFERKLELVGVGYRAAVQGKSLNLTLGYSHPVSFPVPEGISIETPSQTEIVVKGVDRQKVGQIAAVLRGYRPPEPYKGKGVRYAGEKIAMKEGKKK